MTFPESDRQAVDTLTEAYQQIIRELGKVIVGHRQVVGQGDVRGADGCHNGEDTPGGQRHPLCRVVVERQLVRAGRLAFQDPGIGRIVAVVGIGCVVKVRRCRRRQGGGSLLPLPRAALPKRRAS